MFRPIIGLEIHAQLSTKTKLFCGCDNMAWGSEPNVHTCPVCLGCPGQLPVINSGVIDKGILLGLALGCEIPEVCRFDRKNYFYPDNPSGYQITQFDHPVAINGEVSFFVGDEKHSVRINRSHLENDAGKLSHVSDGSLVDWNRAGTPLAEIVSEPDMHSGPEARAYAQAVRSIVRSSGSGHANLERGEMRFDVNISLEVTKNDGSTVITPITEVKNINSFAAIEEVVTYESAVLEKEYLATGLTMETAGKTTKGWNADSKSTYVMRSKENAADYRYFPEPDLPPIHVSRERVEEITSQLPELPLVRADRFVSEFNLNLEQALSLTEESSVADYFEDAAKISNNPISTCNWITTSLFAKLSDRDGKALEITESPISSQQLGEMIALIESGDISGKIAKDVFDVMWNEGGSPQSIVEEKGWKQVSDAGAIEAVCQEVIDENQSIVEEIRGGKDRAFGALVGQVMKKTSGQANPGMVNEILKKLIS